MFDFLKSPTDLEREFRDWAVANRVRVFGVDQYSQACTEVAEMGLIWLIETSAADIRIHAREVSIADAFSAFTPTSTDPRLDAHFKRGAKVLNALLKRRGWNVTISRKEPMNGGLVVVELDTGNRVRD